jgi:hypothetical protein
MAMKARTCAVDIGSMWVKGLATVPGGTRQTTFPTRLAMGSRALLSRENPPQVVRFGDAHVRVGDRSSRSGFVEAELPKALSDIHCSAVLIAAAFERLGIGGSTVLMVGSSTPINDYDAAYLRSSLSRCVLSNGSTVSVDRVGTMGSVEAAFADFCLDKYASISVRGGREERGRFAVVDFGSAAWRVALVTDGARREDIGFAKSEIVTGMEVERRACEIVESRLNVTVSGVAEMFETGVYLARRAKRDVNMHIAQARRETWARFGPSLVDQLKRHGASTVYAAGGNATLLTEASVSTKDIDFQIAKHCETSIVKGLLKSARRWGVQG